MSLYNEIFYGEANSFYESPISISIYNLQCYQNNADNIIFYWSLFPYQKELLTNYDIKWLLTIDKTPDFSSDEKLDIEFDNDPNNGFIIEPNSQLVRAILLPIKEYSLLNKSKMDHTDLYARLTFKNIDLPSNKIGFIKFKLLYDTEFSLKTAFYSTQAIVTFDIPDISNENGYNEYIEEKNYHKLIDCFLFPLIDYGYSYQMFSNFLKKQMISDDYIKQLASYIEISKPINMSFLDFREIILSYYFEGVKYAGTFAGVKNFLKRIYKTAISIIKNEDIQHICVYDNDNNVYIVDYEHLDTSPMGQYYYIDGSTYGYGYIVSVINAFPNPELISFDLIKSLVRKLMPAHIRIYFQEIKI